MELCLNAIINNGKLNNLGTTINKNKHVCTIFIKQMKMLRSLKENNQKIGLQKITIMKSVCKMGDENVIF